MKKVVVAFLLILTTIVLTYTVYASNFRIVETITVPEGTITETTEIVGETADSSVQTDKVDEATTVVTDVSEVPEGTVIERIELIGPKLDSQSQAGAEIEVELEIVEINTREGIIPTVRPANESLDSATTFWDDLYASCGSGAQFKFSTNQGNVYYILNWEGGHHSNVLTCQASTCNFTITTSWSAFYTTASATVYHPNKIWGPDDAYTCK